MASLTLKDVQGIADKLKSAPDLPAHEKSLTKKEAVLELKPTITSLRERGYSVEQIAELLQKAGLEITFGSLRQYLATHQGGRRKRGVKASATPPATSTTAAQSSTVTASTKSTTSPKTPAPSTKPVANGGGGTFQPKPDSDEL